MEDSTHSGSRLRLGVLASGGGTNLQAILDRIHAGSLDAEVGVVISNNSQAGALERARARQVPALHLSSRQFPDPADLDAAVLRALRGHGVGLIALAGYMKRLGPRVLGAYPDRILNVHPALLPAFGGQGMYGIRVHEAVIASGVRFTGVTVHFVDEVYDHGPIIAQRAVPVEDDDTPESLFERVLKVEHALYPEVLQWFAEGRVRMEGRRVYIEKR